MPQDPRLSAHQQPPLPLIQMRKDRLELRRQQLPGIRHALPHTTPAGASRRSCGLFIDKPLAPANTPARRQAAAGGTTAHRTSSREKKPHARTGGTTPRHHQHPATPISQRLREPDLDRPHPPGRHLESSFRDPGRAAIAASQLRPRAQPARRGRRRLVATFPERAYRVARPHRGAGLPARRQGAAAVGPPRRLGRHPAPPHRRCGPRHPGRLVHHHSPPHGRRDHSRQRSRRSIRGITTATGRTRRAASCRRNASPANSSISPPGSSYGRPSAA